MRGAIWSKVTLMVGLMVLTLGQCAYAANEEEKEERIALDKVPKAVVAAISKMFPKAEMTGVTKEVVADDEEDGGEKEDEGKGKKEDEKEDEKDNEGDEKSKIVYEVTLKENGQAIDVTVEESGEIEEVERVIDLKDLPKVVTDALARKFPKSTLKSAEAIYEVEDGELELEGYEVKLETAEKKEIEADVELEVEISVAD